MDSKFSAGLTDQDELSQFPSAANPLTALGIDPDLARANPDMLTALTPGGAPMPEPAKAIPGPIASTPTGAAPAAPSASAKEAGELGGAAVAPAPMSATDYATAGLGTLNRNATLADQAAEAIPTASPEAERLAAQRQKLATPTPLYDPATGKMLSSTTTVDGQTIDPRASRGRKIWRGVRGGLVGLLTGGIPGAVVGALEPQDIRGGEAYGAPNATYEHAEQQRVGELNANDAAQKSALDNWKQAVEAQKARAGLYKDAGDMGKEEATQANILADLPNKTTQAQADKERADNETPDAKGRAAAAMEQSKINTRRNDPIAQSLPKGYIRNRYILTGEMQPAHEATAEERNVAALESAWRTANPGKKMAETDLAQIYREAAGAKESGAPGSKPIPAGTAARISDTKNKAMEQATTNLRAGYTKTGTYTKKDWLQDMQAAQDQYEQAIEAAGGTVNHMTIGEDGNWKPSEGAPASASAAEAANAPATASATPPAGADGQAMGEDGKLHWVNSQTRKVLGVVGQ